MELLCKAKIVNIVRVGQLEIYLCNKVPLVDTRGLYYILREGILICF